MTFFGSTSVSSGVASSVVGNGNRSQLLGRRYQSFANPFFDQAGTYVPSNIKSLFGFCRFYYLTHGIINSVITRASEYPVTDLVFQHKDKGVVAKWEDLMHSVLNYRVLQFEINLDYFVYGNAFVSPSFPFVKKLICQHCSAEQDAMRSRSQWRYTNHDFWLSCPKCGQGDWARSRDDYTMRYSDIGLIRWNPENVHVFYNESTGRLDYALDISAGFRSQIEMGRKDLVATTPKVFLDAVRMRSCLVFDRTEVFHLRRPSLSTMSRGWGIPLIMPVLKDAFYIQVMRKAQEAILLTHITPQIFLFPQPATAGADPFTTTNLAGWREHLRRELARQRLDPAYYGILPFPIGHQDIGANGRQLLLMPEIQQANEIMIAGMGFPVELVFGRGTYAGSSVSMRMLENFFLSNMHGHQRLLNWVMKRLGSYLNMELPTGRFKPFRMADDVQRQGLMMQLNQMNKVSETTLLNYIDLNLDSELEQMVADTDKRAEVLEKQQMQQAEIAGKAQTIMAKYQAKAEEAMALARSRAQQQPSTDPFSDMQSSQIANQQAGMPLDAVVAALAEKVKTMPQDQQAVYLAQLQESNPEMAQLLQEQEVPELPEPEQAGLQAGGVDFRPMPEVLPPRRSTLA